MRLDVRAAVLAHVALGGFVRAAQFASIIARRSCHHYTYECLVLPLGTVPSEEGHLDSNEAHGTWPTAMEFSAICRALNSLAMGRMAIGDRTATTVLSYVGCFLVRSAALGAQHLRDRLENANLRS